MTKEQLGRKNTAANKVLPKAGLNGFDWTFVQGLTFVLRLNFCAKNPAFGNTQNVSSKMKYTIYIALLSILFSCNSEKRTFVITFDNANGLVEGNPVVINDYQIGEVKKISLSEDYKINAEIILTDTIRLPKDSKFTITSRDLFTKAIMVTPGKSKYYLLHSDKIIGQQAQSMKLDTIINVITNEINNSKPVKNQDSIISELHKMNVQIEEIKKK